jgi:hypothetical protein
MRRPSEARFVVFSLKSFVQDLVGSRIKVFHMAIIAGANQDRGPAVDVSFVAPLPKCHLSHALCHARRHAHSRRGRSDLLTPRHSARQGRKDRCPKFEQKLLAWQHQTDKQIFSDDDKAGRVADEVFHEIPLPHDAPTTKPRTAVEVDAVARLGASRRCAVLNDRYNRADVAVCTRNCRTKGKGCHCQGAGVDRGIRGRSQPRWQP